MQSPIRNAKDFWTGVIFVGAGLAFLVIAQDYQLGNARRMGPAFFPTMLSVLLILIGLATGVRGFLTPGTPIGRFAFWPMVLITLGTVVFGVLMRWIGLVPSVVALVLITSYASIHFRLRASVLLAIGLAAFCALVFIHALGLPMTSFGVLYGG